jgi:hypothetical protein
MAAELDDTLSSILRRQREERGGALALADSDHHYTYDELWDTACLWSGGLAEIGVAAGDRREFDHRGIPPLVDDAAGQKAWTAGARAFGKKIWDIVGQRQDPAMVFEHGWFTAWDRLARLRTPTITALAGYAIGGGRELLLCDMIVAARMPGPASRRSSSGSLPVLVGPNGSREPSGRPRPWRCASPAASWMRTKARPVAGVPCRSGRSARGRVERARPDDRVHVGDGGVCDQGVRQPQLRVEPDRGRPVRAPRLPRRVRDR